MERVNKVAQGRPHIVDRISDGGIDLIFNTTEGWQSLKDSQPIRASALAGKVPYYTTAAASVEAARAIVGLATRSLEVRPLQSYYSQLAQLIVNDNRGKGCGQASHAEVGQGANSRRKQSDGDRREDADAPGGL